MPICIKNLCLTTSLWIFIYILLYLQKSLVGEKKITQYFLPEAKRNMQLRIKDLDILSIPLESPIRWETLGNLLFVMLNNM